MSLVRTFTHLAGQLHAPEALNILKRIADLVHPVMKNHGWVLPVLAEFFPDDPRLLGLNVNAGAKILIRLRPARSPGTFYPMEQLMGTMLHELTHNVHGPHDERFYAFLNKLEAEYDTLVIGGWRGTGFFAPGDKLGGQGTGWWGIGGSSNQFDTTGRRKALEAAESRRRIEAFGRGGRLGGATAASQGGKTRQELAAEAADRRRHDEHSCAASHPSADREAARAAADSIADVVADADLAEALALSSALAMSATHVSSVDSGASSSRPPVISTRSVDDDIIEIDSDSDTEHMNLPAYRSAVVNRRCPTCRYLNPGLVKSRCVTCNSQLPTSLGQLLDEAWNCTICTLENNSRAQVCQACGFPKDKKDWDPKRRGGASFETQAEPETERSTLRTWSCELCTFVNAHASRTCSMCEAPCPLAIPRASGPRQSGPSLGSGGTVRGKGAAPSPPTWDCRQCGRQGIAHEFWMCGACGWVKDNSSIPR